MPVLLSMMLSGALAQEPDYAAECEAGKAASCVLLSILAEKSPDPSERGKAEGWLAKGAAILDAACAEKDRSACERLGDVWLTHGNTGKARQAWERACDLDAADCVDLADKMSDRRNMPPEIPRALLERSCGHDVGLGCVGAAILAEENGAAADAVRPTFDKGLSLLVADCEHATDKARAARACNSLGDLHYYGVFQEPDRDQGLAYWARGCTSGMACRAKATLVLAGGDRQGSISLLRHACELGDCEHWEKACAELDTEAGPCAPLVQ